MPWGIPHQLTGVKWCRKCKEFKDIKLLVFRPKRNMYDSICIECSRAAAKEWQRKNKQKAYTRIYAWIEKNRARHNEFCRKTYRKNKERCLIQGHLRRVKVRNAGSFTVEQWNALLEKYDYKCLACGMAGIKLTKDHIIPIALGGTNVIDNIQPLCSICNKKKHIKIIDYRPVEVTT